MGCNSRQLKSRIERNLRERWNNRPRYPTNQPASYGLRSGDSLYKEKGL
ncbi:MAG: hypothetical protein HY362_03975 [Candidatus Aenigmarchaeota archaeon]|nr:hypothetical protein [Candidatus Aenigmarchaeota archaeon]